MNNLCQKGVTTHLLRLHKKRLISIDGTAGDLILRDFGDWHGFACDHRFIDTGFTFRDQAVHGDFIAGFDPKDVPGLDRFDAYLLFFAIH